MMRSYARVTVSVELGHRQSREDGPSAVLKLKLETKSGLPPTITTHPLHETCVPPAQES